MLLLIPLFPFLGFLVNASLGRRLSKSASGLVAVAAMVPLGRPVKQLTKLTRKPVESFATIDRFDGEPLRP